MTHTTHTTHTTLNLQSILTQSRLSLDEYISQQIPFLYEGFRTPEELILMGSSLEQMDEYITHYTSDELKEFNSYRDEHGFILDKDLYKDFYGVSEEEYNEIFYNEFSQYKEVQGIYIDILPEIQFQDMIERVQQELQELKEEHYSYTPALDEWVLEQIDELEAVIW